VLSWGLLLRLCVAAPVREQNLICDFDYQKFLRTIEGIDSLHFLSDELYSSTTHLVYLVKPTISNMRLIAGHVMTHKETDKTHVYTLLMAPRKTMLAERELEEQGVKDEIGRIGEFQLELIPMDGDLLSMEWESAYRELYLEGDSSCLYSIARSLMKVQSVYGLVPVVKGKGNQASRVWQLM
jgi:vacuolar protein sorting-associated protein 33A